MALLLAMVGCAQLQPARESQLHNCKTAPEALNAAAQHAQSLVSQGFAPGVVVSVNCDGRSLLETAHGHAHRESQRPMTSSDLFRVYSMTKPITSLAALMLVDDGKLELDQPISRYLPAFASARVYTAGDGDNVLTAEVTRQPTVRDLLRHTAGLTYRGKSNAVTRLYERRGIDNGAGPKVIPEDSTPTVDNIDEFVTRIASVPLLNQPGERFTYGNATDVLAAVIAKASGQRYRDFLAQRIFEPLGMRDTGFDIPSAQLSRMTAAYAAPSVASTAESGSSAGVRTRLLRTQLPPTTSKPMLSLVDPPRSFVFAAPRSIDFGGAGLVSTAQDYQRFLSLLLNQGRYENKQLVKPSSVALMLNNALPAAAVQSSDMASEGLGFGLGLAIVEDSAKTGLNLPVGGAFWAGAASTYFWIDPERKLTVVVMTQVFGGDVAPFYMQMLASLYR